MTSSTASLSSVICSLKCTCKNVAAVEYASPSDQVRALFSTENDGIDFAHFYLDTFLPAFIDTRKSVPTKSADEAKKYKKQAEMYLGIIGSATSVDTTTTTPEKDEGKGKADDVVLSVQQESLIKQAFTYVNRALLWAPPTDAHLLTELYMLRSKLHYALCDYSLALVDIERAIRLRPTSASTACWCSERKVDLLKRLGRHQDAYIFIEAQLEKKVTKLSKGSQRKNQQQQVAVKKLRQWKSELKAYKPKIEASNVLPNTEKAQEENKAGKSSVYIKLNQSVNLYRDENHQRIVFKAVAPLAAKTEVLSEQPTMAVLESSTGAHLLYCAHCLTDCENSFIPCPNCQDLLFCSDACAQMSLLHGDHKDDECSGVRALLNAHLSPSALEAFRLLARQGSLKELLDAEKKEMLLETVGKDKMHISVESLTDALATGVGQQKSEHDHHYIDSKTVQQIFAKTQIELRNRLLEHVTAFSDVQLSSALLQLLFYMAVKNVGKEVVEVKNSLYRDIERVTTLVTLLAAEQTKAELIEYGWHKKTEMSTVQHGHFQCLLGSQIGHSCQPNAEWSFDNTAQRFYIHTTR